MTRDGVPSASGCSISFKTTNVRLDLTHADPAKRDRSDLREQQ